MNKSSDPIDQASEVEAAFTEAAIENARKLSASKSLRPKGECHNCADPLEYPDQIFCDIECAEDYHYVQERRRANGVA